MQKGTAAASRLDRRTIGRCEIFPPAPALPPAPCFAYFATQPCISSRAAALRARVKCAVSLIKMMEGISALWWLAAAGWEAGRQAGRKERRKEERPNEIKDGSRYDTLPEEDEKSYLITNVRPDRRTDGRTDGGRRWLSEGVKSERREGRGGEERGRHLFSRDF